MKRYILPNSVIVFFFLISYSYSQESYPSGSPMGKIYASYKYQLTGEQGDNQFEIEKALLGYTFNIDNNFSTQIVIEMKQTPVVEGDTKRYVLLRNALIAYKKDKLTVTFGLSDGRGHKVPFAYWGKRYLSKPFLLNYKYLNIADLGIIVDYRLSSRLSVDAAILNGEGHTKMALDNKLLYAAGVTFIPAEGMAIRLYSDIYSRGDSVKNTVAAFAGYRDEKFSIGIEGGYKADYDWTDKHNVYGFSGFAGYMISQKVELFGRYDRVSSVILDGETNPWNIDMDGSHIISGLQYIHSPSIKFSINYQGWFPTGGSGVRWDFAQLNTEFRF
ncbi:MAG TPA: hypothetical protein VMW76_08625 [Bacteroidales bacterium]|nr:hypothetical protein [Bacteroidales bacterium]